VVALTLREFNRTVMTGGVVSAAAGLLAAVPHIDVAEKHTVYKEHLQPSACVTMMSCNRAACCCKVIIRKHSYSTS
jgi:hypothetical protein